MDECTEYAGLSRRGLFRGVAVAGASTAFFGTTFMQTSYAATRSAPSVLVVLSLRGAADGLSLVVPHADPAYYSARPRLAIAKSQLLVADGFFGLHPALQPLVPLWNAGKMAAIHATGTAVASRSHFAAMEEVEDADPGSSARVGWLNRLIGRDTYRNPLQAVQIGEVPITAVYGPEPTFTVSSIEDAQIAGHDQWDTTNGRPRSLHTLWDAAPGPLGKGARSALSAVDDFAPVRATAAAPANGASYPQDELGEALASAARTIKGDIGADVIAVDHGGWDMHTNLGDLSWGAMRQNAASLAGGLAAFFTDLGALADKVTVVTISEFGRRVKENASWGLDHGHGNVMFALGAGVKGGYYGTWPALQNTLDSDLSVTTDYRSVLSEIVTRRFDVSNATVFPGFAPESIGFMA
jgi:uncharacterized protein (DUF1501 family)